MDMFIVAAGEPFSIHDATEDGGGMRLTGIDGRRLRCEDYGIEWVVVEGHGADDAAANARAYDERRHPAQVEMEAFAAAYRAGAVSLVQSDDVVS